MDFSSPDPIAKVIFVPPATASRGAPETTCRACGHCGSTLPEHRPRWCSEACFWKARAARGVSPAAEPRRATCGHCRAPLTGKRRLWCSVACYHKEKDARRLDGPHGATCRNCGGPLEGQRRLWCSGPCWTEARGDRRSAEIQRERQQIRPCIDCGEGFRPSSIKGTLPQRCEACRAEHRRRQRKESRIRCQQRGMK